MFSALTITSIEQGMTYDEATSVRAFAKLAGLVRFATKLLPAVQVRAVAPSRPLGLVRA